MSDDPFAPHEHEPNLEVPSGDGRFQIIMSHNQYEITTQTLQKLPRSGVSHTIVSTGHGASGPFAFGGVSLLDLLQVHFSLPQTFAVEVRSADGFGCRIQSSELQQSTGRGPILLADTINGYGMSRQQGAVRLVVPTETDDALRQVKWVADIKVVLSSESVISFD